MADFNSSLPVRTENPGDVVARIADATVGSQQLAVDSSGRLTANQGAPNTATNGWPVKPTDGTNSQSFTAAGEAKVDVTSSGSFGSVTGGTAGTSSTLVGGQYNSTLPTLTTGQQAAIQLDSSGRVLTDGSGVTQPVSGTVTANQGTANATPWNENIAQIAGAVPSATNALPAQIATAGAFVSSTNPFPVSISSTTAGTPIQNYNTSVALAAGSSVTFTYTVAAAHTFTLQRVWSSASGKIKSLVQNNGTTIFVGFNSTATPNIDMVLMTAPTIAAGNTVTVTITNDDKAAMDVYATIEGNQN